MKAKVNELCEKNNQSFNSEASTILFLKKNENVFQ